MIDAIILLFLFSTIIYFSWAIKKVSTIHMDCTVDEHRLTPTRAHKDDAGLDLKAKTWARIPVNGRVTINTGFSGLIPAGEVGLVFSRSGHGLKGVRIANSVGVIDAGYTGNIAVTLENNGNAPFEIQPGDRIAQLVTLPITQHPLRIVEQHSTTERGTKGLGSTGK